MTEPLPHTVYQYGTHELQRIGVWDLALESPAAEQQQYWIIYIHGGAWRDPRITHKTFEPSIARLLKDDFARSRIRAFASVDYRLSPHPDFPQDPSATPADRFRGARHPDHLDDVRRALRFLQERFGFGNGDYVLAGHSAGATLAYQLVADDGVAPPAAVCGLEGIYDFRGLDARVGGAYAGFLAAAFGDDRAAWDRAAPMKYADGAYAGAPGQLRVLAHSPDDELVDMPETDGMARRLLRDADGCEDQMLLIRDLSGRHDDVWRGGEGVASVVSRALRRVGELQGPGGEGARGGGDGEGERVKL
ncbi:alpha/beta-hydrolase [Hypoxylon sp. FL1284]|nr:alpha/beta-hydrolase [Hypoxylon sp. FL1284]